MTENEILNNRYQLVRPIGRGSFGEVWMAKDLQLDITVAVKVYAALDGKGITEFKDEFKNVYKLLISKERGPRLYLFLYAIDRERFMHLLDFSHPETEEEIAAAESRIEELNEQLTLEEVYSVPSKCLEVQQALEQTSSHLNDLYQQWENLYQTFND